MSTLEHTTTRVRQEVIVLPLWHQPNADQSSMKLSVNITLRTESGTMKVGDSDMFVTLCCPKSGAMKSFRLRTSHMSKNMKLVDLLHVVVEIGLTALP